MTWWNKYVGKEFEEKGRGPECFDCWGLVRWVYKYDHSQNYDLPDYLECYETTNDRENLSKVIFEETGKNWIVPTSPKEFDVILLRMRGLPMHVGIVTKKGHMLHCAQGIGTVHESFESLRWKNKILGFFRYE